MAGQAEQAVAVNQTEQIVAADQAEQITLADQAYEALPGRKPVICVGDLYEMYRVGKAKVRALNGVDSETYKGEFTAIVSTLGSSRSTLLSTLAGLEKPTRGEIEIGRVHIEKMTGKQLVTFRYERVGLIFQAYNLPNIMNAAGNATLPFSFHDMSKRGRPKRAEKFMDLVSMGDQAKRMFSRMSGGQQQRVGIARALVISPETIFADEPTGNLGSRTAVGVLRLIQTIVKERRQAPIMVIHDNSLTSYADRRTRIVNGKVVAIEAGGRPAEENYIEEEVCDNETDKDA